MASDTDYAGMSQYFANPSGQTGGIYRPGATRSMVDPGISSLGYGSSSIDPSMSAWPSFMPNAPAGSGYGPANYDVSTDASARSWATNQLFAQGMTENAPEFAKNQIARENMGYGIAQLNQQYGQERGFLNKDYDIGSRKLDVKQQGLDIEDAANARKPGYLSALHDIAGRGFDLTRQENVAKNRQGNFALFNESVGAGNVLSGGYNVQRGELAQQLMRNQAGVGLEQEDETVKFNEQMAQTQDTDKALDLEAKNLGLDRESLQSTLEQGLSRLSLNTNTSVRDLFDAMQSSNLDTAMMARNIFQQAYQASDGPMKAMYPGTGGPSQYDYSIPREHMAGR